MSRVESITITRLDNGYTVYNSYTLSSSKNYYKTEEEVIKAAALALSNNIEPDKIFDVKIEKEEMNEADDEDV